ncbi:MAG TPA: hypothetical protein VGF61_15890 [Candidatus Acidoferrum sp.]
MPSPNRKRAVNPSVVGDQHPTQLVDGGAGIALQVGKKNGAGGPAGEFDSGGDAQSGEDGPAIGARGGVGVGVETLKTPVFPVFKAQVRRWRWFVRLHGAPECCSFGYLV